MLTVITVHDHASESELQQLLHPEPGSPVRRWIAVDSRSVAVTGASETIGQVWPEVRSVPAHLLVFATASIDPDKKLARQWARVYSEHAQGLHPPVVFVGAYHAGNLPPDANWTERTLVTLAPTPDALVDDLLRIYADLASPRLLVVDDQEQYLPRVGSFLPSPIANIAEKPVWVSTVLYKTKFSERHDPTITSERHRLRLLARTEAIESPTKVLIDLRLHNSEDEGFEECRAVATEILALAQHSWVVPVSAHGEQEVHKESFSILGQLFPGRVWIPVDKPPLDNRWALGVTAALARPTASLHQAAPRRPGKGDFAVDIAAQRFELQLRLAAITWLGPDFPWVFSGLTGVGTPQAQLVFERSQIPESVIPTLARYRELIPSEVPVGFLADWSPGRLAGTHWRTTESAQVPDRVHRPLFDGNADVTVGAYLDLDNIVLLSSALQQRMLRAIVDSVAIPTQRIQKRKVWFVVAGGTKSTLGPKGSRVLQELWEAVSAKGLFAARDLDRLEIRVVPSGLGAGEAADTAFHELVRFDGVTTRKVIATQDKKLLESLSWFATTCTEHLIVVTSTLIKFRGNVRVVHVKDAGLP